MVFDKQKYKVWKLPHPLLLHWVINPGLAFNELVLGQRIPRVTLIDRTSDAPLMQRQYIPCPECRALNDGRLWSGGNTFGHWFGYVCPECHGRIPCLWNLTSLIVLVLTFPVWIWIKLLGEEKWLEKEKHRFSAVTAAGLPEADEISWVRVGFGFGLMMFCIMVLPRLFLGTLAPVEIATQAVIWLIAGLVFGVLMKLCLGSRR